MKKTIFSAAILIAALGFTGCEGSKNGGDLTINAKVKNGNLVKVDEARAVGYIYSETPYGYYDWNDIIIATALYKNGGFKIKLPKDNIDARLIETIDFEDAFDIDVTVSNNNVKGAMVEGFLAFKNNEEIGEFIFLYYSYDAIGYVLYMFVDSDCKIYGYESDMDQYDGQTYKWEDSVDLDLKKGWNTVYEYYMAVGNSEIYKITTKKPELDFTWYYNGDYYDKAPQKDFKRMPQKIYQLLNKIKANNIN